MRLLFLFIFIFGGFMIGVVIYPMWKTDRVVLAIAREAKAGMNLTDILAAHPGFTYVKFSKETGSEPCMTVVNVDGAYALLVTNKSKRRPRANEPFNFVREWSLSGRCPTATIVYESLYRKGYVYAPVNDRLQLTDVVNTASMQ